MRLAALALTALCTLPHARAADAALIAVFQRMDKAAATFKGVTGDLKRLNHQDILGADGDTASTGKVAVRRPKPHDIQYLLTLHEVDPPRDEIVSLGNKLIQIYHPSIKTVYEGDLTKALKSKAEQFLALGFGTTSDDLQSNYAVTLVGLETVDGQKVTRLDLVPKSQDVLQIYRKISMWVSDTTGQAVQLKLIQPGMRDYEIDTYSNMKFGEVPESAVKLDLPKNVKRE